MRKNPGNANTLPSASSRRFCQNPRQPAEIDSARALIDDTERLTGQLNAGGAETGHRFEARAMLMLPTSFAGSPSTNRWRYPTSWPASCGPASATPKPTRYTANPLPSRWSATTFRSSSPNRSSIFGGRMIAILRRAALRFHIRALEIQIDAWANASTASPTRSCSGVSDWPAAILPRTRRRPVPLQRPAAFGQRRPGGWHDRPGIPPGQRQGHGRTAYPGRRIPPGHRAGRTPRRPAAPHHLKIGACLEAATGDPIALLRPATSNSRSASSTPAGGSSSKRSAPSRPDITGITIDEACNDIFWSASSPYWRNATRMPRRMTLIAAWRHSTSPSPRDRPEP